MSRLSTVTTFIVEARCLEITITMLVYISIIGTVPAMGTLFLPLLDRYNEGRSKTAVVISLFKGLSLGCGVFAGYLIRKMNVEKVSVLGGVLLTAGYIGAFFSKTIFHLYITIGILCGVGISFIMVSLTTIMTRLVQSKNVPLALTLISVAPGTAGIFFPYFLDFLEQTYSLPGTFLILGGICLNSLFFLAMPMAFVSNKTDPSKRPEQCPNDTQQNQVTDTENLKKDDRRCPHPFKLFIVVAYVTGTASVALVTGGFAGLWQDMFLEKGLSKSESFVCFVCYTAMNTVSRILPMIAKRFDSLSLFLIPLLCSILGVTSQLSLYLFNSFGLMAVGSSLLGFCGGGIITASSLVMYDVLGEDGLSAGYGFYLTMSGITISVSGTTFGAIVDATSSYKTVTMITSGVMCASSIIFLVCLLAWRKRKAVVHVQDQPSKTIENKTT